MRVNCDIVISNRLSHSLTSQGQAKPRRSSLMVGKKTCKGVSGDNVEKLALLITTNKEPLGQQYQIENNVEQMFTKFIQEGRCTIRIKNPPVDILISKADPKELETFVNVLKVTDPGKLPRLAALEPATKKELQSGKTKLIIKSPREYPTLTAFPKNLLVLTIQDCNLNRIEKRIASLKTVGHLSFENNRISEVPLELGLMELNSLVLKKNRITSLKGELFTKAWKSTLMTLDLSENSIENLPAEICHLDSLADLSIARNALKCLPEQVGKLRNLKELKCGSNKLSVLPGSIIKLRLNSIDIAGNLFKADGIKQVDLRIRAGVHSLLDCAAVVILAKKIPYGVEDLPGNLIHYLSRSKECLCGMPFFKTLASTHGWYDLSPIAHTLTTDYSKELPIEIHFCSVRCGNRYNRNPFVPKGK